MKLLLIVILTFLCFSCIAQTQSGADPQSDDGEFLLFLMMIAVGFACIAVGSVLAGTAAMTLVLLALFALISAGIVSAGVLVGLYRRSLAAGFKTVVILVCSCVTTIAGAIGFWLINHIFHLYLTNPTSLLIGSLSGLVGGVTLGFILTSIIRLFLDFCRRKLSL